MMRPFVGKTARYMARLGIWFQAELAGLVGGLCEGFGRSLIPKGAEMF